MKKQVFIVNNIEFVVENDEELLESFATLSLNPTIKWIKFDLTDNKPNANKQRIPQSEFTNLIKTGIHMPIKMAEGFIRDGHEFAMPIGAITGLIEQGEQVKGIAALWSREFPHEIEILEKMSDADVEPQLSWELLYQDSSYDEESGIEDLLGVALSAATVVNMPAYEGRTSITKMASTEASKEEEEKKKMEERVKELELLLKEAAKDKEVTENLVQELTEKVSDLETSMKELEESNEELANYKIGVEEDKAKADKLVALKELFLSAGVELPDEYLEDEEKMASLLEMDLNQIEFLIQEIGIFASTDDPEGSEASLRLGSRTNAPNLRGKGAKKPSNEKIVESLKERAK
jgi:predicted GNAT family acetyltransferase